MRLIDQQVAVVSLVVVRVAFGGFSAKWFQWMFQAGDKGVFLSSCERARRSILKLEEIRPWLHGRLIRGCDALLVLDP